MKPINFIELKKENKDLKKIFFLLFPICLFLLFLGFDLYSIYFNAAEENTTLISLDEVVSLENKLNSLTSQSMENELKANYYKHLDLIKDNEAQLLQVIDLFANNTSDNIFINSFSYNSQIVNLTGISLNSELLDDLDKAVMEKTESLTLNEVNFENGYYKFSYKGDIK